MNFLQEWFPSKEQKSVDELLDLWVPCLDIYRNIISERGHDFPKIIWDIIELYDNQKIQMSCTATRWKVECILNKYRK